MELGGNSCPVKQLAAGLGHPLVGGLSGVLSKGARGIGHNEDVVSLLDQTKSREGNADLGQNTAAKRQMLSLRAIVL